MRVLLDEQLPVGLAEELIGHDVGNVGQQGWAGMTNGALLANAIDRGFGVFLTADQNLEYQQNLSESPLGVVVLHGKSNKIDDLRPLVPGALEAIERVKPGEVEHVFRLRIA